MGVETFFPPWNAAPWFFSRKRVGIAVAALGLFVIPTREPCSARVREVPCAGAVEAMPAPSCVGIEDERGAWALTVQPASPGLARSTFSAADHARAGPGSGRWIYNFSSPSADLEWAVSGDLVPVVAADDRWAFARSTVGLAVLSVRPRVVDSRGVPLAVVLEARGDPGDGSAAIRLRILGPRPVYPLTIDLLVASSVWASTETDATHGLAWGDWNRDGILDLSVANDTDPVRIYTGTGTGLVVGWSAPSPDNTTRPAWGDWNHDGILDLAGVTSGGFYVSEILNPELGEPAFLKVWQSEVDTPDDPVSPADAAWADWDGDGDLDLALATSNLGAGLRVFENVGGSLEPAASANPGNASAVAWADWDGDGDLDLAVTGTNIPTRVYRNQAGTLVEAWAASVTEPSSSLAWGDWNRDGRPDLAVGNVGAPNRLYRNIGGDMVSFWASADSDSTESVAWGDWDGDGDLDLAAGNYGEPNRVYDNDGTAMSSAWTSADSEPTTVVAWGDWDGDGDLDLAAGNDGASNRVYENLAPRLIDDLAVDEPADALAWGDWDGDGDLDLAVGRRDLPTIVLENLEVGAGTGFQEAWSADAAEGTVSVAWGDWDGDGDLDLAAGNYGSPNTIFRNDGGTLIRAWTSPESEWTRSVAWGDWNGDTSLELAVGNEGVNRVYQHLDGAWTSVWESSETEFTRAVAWGDGDADGDLDLAVGNGLGEPNRVYRNDAGSLESIWSGATDEDTWSVVWGDWGGDGDLDLAFGNSGQKNRIYAGENGGWIRVWAGAESELTRSVAWGDADGDGDLDLAAGNYGQLNRIDWNGGAPSSSSSSRSEFTRAVAFADWDGDGDLDLAAGGEDQPVRLYRNRRIDRPEPLPETPVAPQIAERPGITLAAFFFSSAECLPSPVLVEYRLFDQQSDRARRIVAEYSRLGSGRWRRATAAPGGDGTVELRSSPDGFVHRFYWDSRADFVDWADGVVFRITVPYQASTFVAGPILRAAMSAVSPPFRVCDVTTDLALQLTNESLSVIPGASVTYRLDVANHGLEPLAQVRIENQVDEQLGNVAWTCGPPLETCSELEGWGDLDTTVSLQPGASATFFVTGMLAPDAVGKVIHSARVSPPSQTIDSDPADNQAVDCDPIESLDQILWVDGFESGDLTAWPASTELP